MYRYCIYFSITDQIPSINFYNSLTFNQKTQDQSVCGSCWSFGTVGAVEGAYFLNNGNKLVRLSQQALIDCSWGYGNNGCDGGEDFRAYQWMVRINCCSFV